MAWSWSHTEEAYQNVRDNIAKLPRRELNIVLAEIATSKELREAEDTTEQYEWRNVFDKHLQFAINIDDDSLVVDAVIDFAEDYRTCENGGRNAYICPHGCHTVSFDKE